MVHSGDFLLKEKCEGCVCMPASYNKFDMPPRNILHFANGSRAGTGPILVGYSTTTYTVKPLLVDLGTGDIKKFIV